MMRVFGLLLALTLQPSPDPALVRLRTSLQQISGQLNRNKATFGATRAMTDAKHRLRDWVEARLAREAGDVAVRAVNVGLHDSLRRANLLCDDCEQNVIGYVDDVRVARVDPFLVVITAMGTSCGYDESAYLYHLTGGRWQRLWEHEQNTDTPPRYLPQQIHDIQISSPTADGRRLLMELGSQTVCGGSFKDLYARAWKINDRTTKVLDTTVFGNDGYPPLLGRVTTDEVLFTYTADGFASGDTHVAVRRFVVDGDRMKQVEPVAMLPRDFVLEQLPNPRHYGDFPEPTRRCSAAEEWQVGTRLFEGPKRYYRVRWMAPFSFELVSTSETPYADCLEIDSRSDVYPDILRWKF